MSDHTAAQQKAFADALRLYGGITREMELVILNTGRVPTRENTPGWYFEPGGPYYVPKSKFKSDLLDVMNIIDIAKGLETPAPVAPPTVALRLSKFNMALIPDDSVVLFIGRRRTGKTSLIKDLLWYKQKFPIGTVINCTGSYTGVVPSLFIHEEFDSRIISNLLKRQDTITKHIQREKELSGSSAVDRRAFICMDDCLYDNKWINDKYVRSLFMNGRHYGLLYILAIQYVMGIPPVLRGQVDYVFILREEMFSARKRIYEQFASIFPTFEIFSQIMDQCTEDYSCLVIYNGSKTNRIEDCVFWYKAESHEDFKIGSRELWIRSAEYDALKEASESVLCETDAPPRTLSLV
jgi:hypothetical protein